jgi:low affinity Fe/Cu permease
MKKKHTTNLTIHKILLLQRSQNKDSLALHIKLNEIIAAHEGASNRLIVVEDLSEREVEILHKHFQELARLAKHDGTLAASHSIEEAMTRHTAKRKDAPSELRLVAGDRSNKPKQEKTS